MGLLDKSILVTIAVIMATLYFTNVVSGTLGIVLLVLAVANVLASLVSWCPLYLLFGWNTCPVKAKK